MRNNRTIISRLKAPLSGQVIPLEQVPDELFSRRILGDGAAILPEDGSVVSPVDGVITTVAETLHAYGIQSDAGEEILIHIGLESITLRGEGFKSFVKPGDRVRTGDRIVVFDLSLLLSRGIDPTTTVVLCSDTEPFDLEIAAGSVCAGKDFLIVLREKAPESQSRTKALLPKIRGLNFDFLQKLGKTLMTVIAVMPAAGLMLSLGKLLQMTGAALPTGIGSAMEQIGWSFINNLHLLFAVAIGGSWARDRAGGAFAAAIAFILINCITGAVFGVTGSMLADENAYVLSLFGQPMPVGSYFTSVLGAPALNMGVFVGIISGFTGGIVYNRYYSYRKLPDTLSFFNGKRFVPLAVLFYSIVLSLILAVIWPLIQSGINAFGLWIAGSAESSPVLAPFIYGTLERLLLPFGLHHMLTIPMNYTSFGGEYLIRTGVNMGSWVYGQDPLWLAWVTDLINFRNAGNLAEYEALLTTVVPGRFKVGQMIGSTGLLMGFALAMYRRVEPDRRRLYRSMFLSTALAVILTGVTEPVEFMFMFCAIPLYLAYSLLQGVAFAMAGVIRLRLHAFGNLEFLTRIPMSLKAGLGGDIVNFLICCAVFGLIGYAVAYFMIGRFGYATPGRLGNYTEENASPPSPSVSADPQAQRIIALLGGRENIVLADACMTRLRVTVRDASKVAAPDQWRSEGALGLLIKGNGIQAVYGPKADVLKSDINDIL